MPASASLHPRLRHLGVATAALLLAACSTGKTTGPTTPVPVAPASAISAAAPLRTELGCIDRTGSLPTWFTARAISAIADQIEQAVVGPMPPAVFHLRDMSATSYSPDAEITTVRLAAVPNAPDPPELSGNPYESAADGELLRARELAVVGWEQSLAKAQAAAAQEADRLRAIVLPTDDTATDVLGCPLRAPDLLGTTGDRHLFIASDLLASGPQQDLTPGAGDLAGVRVTVAFYCVDLAGACADRVEQFTDLLRQAGVTDITVVDPQEM